jgi:hypothetical protein
MMANPFIENLSFCIDDCQLSTDYIIAFTENTAKVSEKAKFF